MYKSILVCALLVFVAACSSPQTTTTTTVQEPPPQETTLVRFVHAIPDAPSVDFWVGNTQAGLDREFRTWGDWTLVPAGEQELVMRRDETIVYDDVFDFAVDERYLVIGYGMLNPMGDEVPVAFMIHEDEYVEENEEETRARFANTIADGDRFGLCITTGGSWNLLWPNQSLGTISEYKLGPLYDNTFEIVPRNTSLPAVHEFEYNLQHGILYTFIATGRIANDTVQVFAVTDHPSVRPQ